jgi:hypothetical protein
MKMTMNVVAGCQKKEVAKQEWFTIILAYRKQRPQTKRSIKKEIV